MQGRKHAKQLCKMINKCQSFKNTDSCEFNHDKCNYGVTCKNPLSCKFYHPEYNFPQSYEPPSTSMAKNKTGKFSLPKDQVPCKFGANCNKKNTCTFNHDIPSQTTFQNKANTGQNPRQCKFGDSCTFFKKGTCRNYHPQSTQHQRQQEPHQQNPINNTNNINNYNNSSNNLVNYNKEREEGMVDEQRARKKQNKKSKIPPGPQIHQQIQQFQNQKQCQKYVMGKCTPRQLNCEKQHSFSMIENSIRRVFYGYISGQTTKVSGVIVKLKDEQFLALSYDYNRFGIFQIDSQFQMLRNVSEYDFIVPSGTIMGLFVKKQKQPGPSNNSRDQIISVGSDDKIYHSDPLSGSMIKQSLENSSKILAIQYFSPKEGECLQIVAISQTGPSFTKYGSNVKIQPQIFLTPANKPILKNIVAMKKAKILQKQVMIYACRNGDVFIMRQDFQFKHILVSLPPNNPILIKDITVVVLGGGAAYVLIAAVCPNTAKSHVISLSLMNLKWGVALSLNLDIRQNDMVSKITNIDHNVLVGVDGVGVLIFKAPSFQSPIARIGIGRQSKIGSLYTDGDSTLILVEEAKVSNGNIVSSLMSVYKIRK